MFSKLKSARLQNKLAKLEQGQPIQHLERLKTLLHTPSAQPDQTEARLRQFATSTLVQTQLQEAEKSLDNSIPLARLLPPINKQTSQGKKLLLTSLALVVIMATGLLLMVYLYAPPSVTPPQVQDNPATTTSHQSYNDCLRTYSNPVDCLIYDRLDAVPAWVNLSQTLDLAQSANGYTMILRRVYADTNNVIVGYELKGNNIDQLGTMVSMKLVLKDNSELVRVAGSWSGATVAPNWKGQLERMNITGLQENTSQLQLKLEVPFIQVQSTRGQAGPGDFSNIPLNFSFDLAVPFYPGQELQLNQANTGATLQKVVATPTEIRVYLDGIGEVAPEAFLTSESQTESYRGELIHYQDTKTIIGFINSPMQAGKSQKWTLQVNPGTVQDWNPIRRFKQMLAGGPWMFKFETR